MIYENGFNVMSFRKEVNSQDTEQVIKYLFGQKDVDKTLNMINKNKYIIDMTCYLTKIHYSM